MMLGKKKIALNTFANGIFLCKKYEHNKDKGNEINTVTMPIAKEFNKTKAVSLIQVTPEACFVELNNVSK